MNDKQENQIHVQLVINIIVLTFSYHHFFPHTLISKASLALPFATFPQWPMACWYPYGFHIFGFIPYWRLIGYFILEYKHCISACFWKRDHSWKYNFSCSRDPKVLEMLGQWKVYKVQGQEWSGAGLNLADKLCVLCMSELEKWAHPSPVEPMSESQMLDTKI